jgi:hypothetical protein
MLLESHDKANVPSACLDYDPGEPSAEIVHTIWFDDPQIVQYAIANFSLPGHVGVFGYNATTAGGVSAFDWTWHEPGGPVSEIRDSRTETIEGGNPSVQRLFWHDGHSVYLMDLTADDKQPLVTPVSNVGVFRDPMMQAGIPTNSGLSSLVDPGAAYTATIHHFGDLECKQLLW